MKNDTLTNTQKWTTPIVIWVVSAISRALDQMVILQREELSYLPDWVFHWNLGLRTFDAFHTYQGITLIAFGLAGYFFYRVLENRTRKYQVIAWIIALYVYYQVFNLFFHVVFLKPEHWEFPFFRFLWFFS
jgi:hypothetical protein